MALFLFADSILNNKPIDVFNHGKMVRDFTYVGDIVESIKRLIVKPPKENQSWNSDNPDIPFSSAPYQLFNIGNGAPVKLMNYINALESALGKKGVYNMMNIQPGDVPATHADTSLLEKYISFKPDTDIKDGIDSFVSWYLKYYKIV
mgnify:CR=1 FL=1